MFWKQDVITQPDFYFNESFKIYIHFKDFYYFKLYLNIADNKQGLPFYYLHFLWTCASESAGVLVKDTDSLWPTEG